MGQLSNCLLIFCDSWSAIFTNDPGMMAQLIHHGGKRTHGVNLLYSVVSQTVKELLPLLSLYIILHGLGAWIDALLGALNRPVSRPITYPSYHSENMISQGDLPSTYTQVLHFTFHPPKAYSLTPVFPFYIQCRLLCRFVYRRLMVALASKHSQRFYSRLPVNRYPFGVLACLLAKMGSCRNVDGTGRKPGVCLHRRIFHPCPSYFLVFLQCHRTTYPCRRGNPFPVILHV